jgi:SAM-dependent methyltransferase
VLADLRLLHFPLRSVDQLLAKGVIGWKANIARTNLSAKAAHQWKRLHDLAISGQRPDASELAREALVYAQDGKTGSLAEEAEPAEHGINVARRHSDGRFAPAERLIAEAEANTAAGPTPFALPAPPAGTAAKAQVSTAFDGAWHWDFLFLDEPLIRSTIERVAPDSVLDLGCGNGLYALLYRHLGVADVLGVDGIEPEASALGPDTYCKADLQAPLDVGRCFDLVICLEVAEHLAPEATQTILDSIARHAKTGGHILFSMAEPGQPGNGHINCRGIAEVLDLWARRGWQPDLAATLGLRAISSMSWFRRNLLLLRHTGEQGETPAARALKRIGAKRYVWYGQPPGQRVTAFAEPYPDLDSGYGLLL